MIRVAALARRAAQNVAEAEAMTIQSIMATRAPDYGRISTQSSSSTGLQDSVEPSRADIKVECGLIPPMIFRPAGAAAGTASLQSQQAGEKKHVSVEIHEWLVGEENTSYTIDTAGCGAIKIFVECGKSSYSIIFHSFGTQESKDAAGQIGHYILGSKEKPESVKILSIQPYAITRSVQDTVKVIRDMLSEEHQIVTEGHVVCLNNVEYEMNSEFIRLDLEGTEEEILGRYAHLVVKPRKMSDEERAMKISLFQSLPGNVRTPEFLRNWSTLSLEEARQVVDGFAMKKKPSGRVRKAIGGALKKVRDFATGSSNSG